MFKKAALLLCLSSSLFAFAGCAPVSTFQGFQAIEQSPRDVKVGQDTRSSVLAKLGTPTATSTFDKNTWFYMSQVSSKTSFYHPRLVKRDIVAIAFDKGTDQVSAVDTFTLKDGRVVAYNGRETPTRGREMTAFEQLLGNLSGAGALPPDDTATPGSHPDQPR
jgi:outer membrane protein assembly factor BamE (lipoprotein component of BamABCDE complex)